jgi:hypothetical protein
VNADPETPEPVYDPVHELASLVATALSDPLLLGFREPLRVSLGVGPGTSAAEIEQKIREAAGRGR